MDQAEETCRGDFIDCGVLRGWRDSAPSGAFFPLDENDYGRIQEFKKRISEIPAWLATPAQEKR
jgi:hypothetical protein